MKALLFAITLVILQACTDNGAEYCATPESVGAQLLSSFNKNSTEVAAIETELAKTKENIKNFYLELKPSEYGYSAYLWHKDSFLPENCKTTGNPGGLNRKYIIENGILIKPLWWQ